MPRVSVIMPVYNNAEYIGEALDSILNQSFQDLEIVVCDDASDDGTTAILEDYAEANPDRVKLIRNSENRGKEYSMNRCLKIADGEFIARMDGDDISHKDRILKQVSFLDEHPEYTFVSASMMLFDENGSFGAIILEGEPNLVEFSYRSPFPHASVVIKRSAFLRIEGYSIGKRYERVQDWDLFVRLYENGYRGYNLKETLYFYREDRFAYKRRPFKYRINETYIGASAVRKLHLPVLYYLFSLRSIIVGILPTRLYILLHRRKLRSYNAGN